MTDAARPLRFIPLDRVPFPALFALGLVARLGGLFFNGMADLYQILLDWGFSVWKHGLVAAFSINYGALSYAAYGLVVRAAEMIPRFWWAPYKLFIVGADVALLVALLQMVPRDRRTAVLVLYWLNPWFILHEPYHGFWEAPHILCGALAVIAVARTNGSPAAWGLTGALLACSAMLKPQGLLYFVGPVGGYLAIQWLRGYRAAFHWWLAGTTAVFLGTSLYFWVNGGSALAVVDNYRSAFSTQSGLSNGGPGIWRFVAFAYGLATAQQEHVAFVRMPRLLIGAGSAAAALSCLAVFSLFALRVAPAGVRLRSSFVDAAAQRLMGVPDVIPRAPGELLLMLLVLGSLVMSQFGVRAHINHSYTAVILLVPLVVQRPTLLRPWALFTGLLALAHVLIYAMGGPVLLPPESILHTYPSAQDLIARVQALPAYRTPDAILVFQQRVWDAIHALPVETIVSLLSPFVFVVACQLCLALFREATGGMSD